LAPSTGNFERLAAAMRNTALRLKPPLRTAGSRCIRPARICLSPRRALISSRSSPKGWKRPFDEPIPVPRGRQLVTLEDAGRYIQKLPKAEQQIEEWQTAVEVLILVAESNGGPTMMARIGVMRALNRRVERVFDPSRKDTQWGRRKLASDRDAFGRKSRCSYLRLKLPSGIPMQVVVPSVSLAALLQGTAPTVFVETPSSAILLKPVSDPEISGPPTSGAPPTVGGAAGDVGAVAGGAVPVVCCANAADDKRARAAAMGKGDFAYAH
jgi:hypothetical protein